MLEHLHLCLLLQSHVLVRAYGKDDVSTGAFVEGSGCVLLRAGMVVC